VARLKVHALKRIQIMSKTFTVSEIITFSRCRNNFFVSWEGYPPIDRSWEPFGSFTDPNFPLAFLQKLKALGAVCDECIARAQSSDAPGGSANLCKCFARSPSPLLTPGKRAMGMLAAAKTASAAAPN
jgi:hypothetical protein